MTTPLRDSGIGRRRLLGWGGLVAAGVPLRSSAPDRTPPSARPGGAYDRYVAGLAAEGRFSGVVMLAHRGRTVLSRAYGMADRERGVRNRAGTAFSLSSAGKPFLPVAVLQLAQQGRLRLNDTVGDHLTGFAPEIAGQVTIHHLLQGLSGTEMPAEDVRRVFHSRDEVLTYYRQRARQARLAGVPGLPTDTHAEAEILIPALIVEAVTGMTYWDYVEENVFRRCGMTGSGFYTRTRWLEDQRIAHPYMGLADGSQVDAIRNLDQGSPLPYVPDKNPGRAFIDAPGDGGFASAPDLVRFAYALRDGTLLAKPWADVLLAPRIPHGPDSFGAYGVPARIVGGQWGYQRAGGNPGVGANWSLYPDTGWVGVILGNADDLPFMEMIERETQAITGVEPGGEQPGG